MASCISVIVGCVCCKKVYRLRLSKECHIPKEHRFTLTVCPVCVSEYWPETEKDNYECIGTYYEGGCFPTEN